VSINGGREPRWRADGAELFFVAPDGFLMAVSVDTGDRFSAGIPQRLFPRPSLFNDTTYGVSRDGQRMLVPYFSEGDDEAGAITVVLNWWAELP